MAEHPPEVAIFAELLTADVTTFKLLPASVDGNNCYVIVSTAHGEQEYRALAMILGPENKVLRRTEDGALHPLNDCSSVFCN